MLNFTYVYHVCRVTGWEIRKLHWHNTISKYLNYYIKLQIYQFLGINKLSYDLTRKSVKRKKTKKKKRIIISVLREAWSLICTTHTHTKRKKTGIPFAQRWFVPLRKKILKCHQFSFAVSLVSPFGKKRGPLFEQN